MSHLTRCDMCQKETRNALAEQAWISVDTGWVRDQVAGETRFFHLCSWTCLAKMAAKKAGAT